MATRLERSDLAYLSPVRSAQVVEAAPAAMWSVYLLLVMLAAALGWAAVAQVDIIAKAPVRIIPEGREQLIASLEGGILRELAVREGEQVRRGQPLATLDPTRVEAQQAEGQTKRVALRGTIARLTAEATGRPLSFPPEVRRVGAVINGESESFEARRRALDDAVAANQRSIALLGEELALAERMSQRGLMSEVEVMRLRRQVNDLRLGSAERINRFRQDASAELVRVRNELALLDEQMVVRDDALKRTVLTSPVDGIVKQIRSNTLGGVVAPGAPLMEIVPVGTRVLVEARVRPADIGFVKVGQPVAVKLSAYDPMIYGSLRGTVRSISPDALGDAERSANAAEGTWYRTLVDADRESFTAGQGKQMRALQVLPGMTGTAEIRTGERTVLEFLFRPMLRTQEAFRER
ncbi:MAG: HlyD family type I secretion periplasmic adaptor subunit [Rubrivivax sp.]|nr:HlyD family type I secretion periplasmic adaptor subunit [Rubrivivax sp.]